MLETFEINNFLSFKKEPLIFTMEKNKKYYNSSILFGANASGKSNFIKSFKAFKDIFILSDKNLGEFQITLEIENNLYWYGNQENIFYKINNNDKEEKLNMPSEEIQKIIDYVKNIKVLYNTVYFLPDLGYKNRILEFLKDVDIDQENVLKR